VATLNVSDSEEEVPLEKADPGFCVWSFQGKKHIRAS